MEREGENIPVVNNKIPVPPSILQTTINCPIFPSSAVAFY
jgi:hypothetical protein